ncbi:hypothetical protein [Nocardia thailandica]|uniref:PPE family domain-containing protein n=1 Tax=Nocardia thailandica TaxID=257275 RepID=A0ABW6PV02_9NOCA
MSGTEAPKIPPTTEYPLCWTHQGILSAFEQIATEPANGAATKYREAGTEWSQALQAFNQRMQTAISSAWEGASATAAAAAIRAYTIDADQLTSTFTTVSNQITAAATSAVDTKNALPGEVNPGTWDLDRMPWNKAVLRGRREDAEDQAREVMGNKYVTPFAGTDTAIPVLPVPATLTNPDSDPGGGLQTTSSGPAGTSTTTSQTPQPQTTPSGGTPENPTDTTTGDEQTTTDDTDESTSTPSTTDENDEETDTTAASAEPSTTTPGTSPSGSPTAGGSPSTGAGSPNTGAGSGLPGTGGLPSAGRSVPGLGTTGTPLTTTAGTGTTTVGTRGMNGMPGMMGAGAGRRGRDDDNEHKIPDYLITDENTNELIGELPRTIRGGVLGGNNPSARLAPTDADLPPGGAPHA